YARPDAPELYLPDDWKLRIEQNHALAFAASADRNETLSNLKQAYPAFDTSPEGIARVELPIERVRPFLAVGFGYLVVEHLFDAMQHEHLLATGEFWADVQNAVTALSDGDANLYLTHLRSAAEKLLAAQLGNLHEGGRVAKELLGTEPRVFGRRRGAYSPHTPQLLLAAGFEKAILLAFDGSVVPTHRSTVVNWSAPDGKQLDAFTR